MTDKKEILRLAALAKLELSEAEAQTMTREMDKIIEFASLVEKASVTGESRCEPSPLCELSDGDVKPSLEREKLLSLSENENGMFRVRGGI